VALVVCQPDRPKGRGQQLQAPPLKAAALELGLRVFQPASVKEAAALETLAACKADLGCVVAYGQILPQALLDLPRLGCVNVHGSLLPRWRGAAPIEWAVAHGDQQTGVCVQRMVYKLDAGDVLLSRSIELGPLDDAPSLHPRLAVLGAELLVQAVDGLATGALQSQPQDEARATYAPLLKKSDGELDFSLPARKLQDRFRAFRQRPGCSACVQGGEPFKVTRLSLGAGVGAGAGSLLGISPRGLEVGCGDGGSVHLEEVQPAGGRAMPGADFARGRHLQPGQQFVLRAVVP
jgi:methionyl-tRNA formyltransferase